jgi:hypothetical protein
LFGRCCCSTWIVVIRAISAKVAILFRMKSMERAKSFVAARPSTTSGRTLDSLRPSGETNDSQLEVKLAPLPQRRSNSVCGPHAAAPKMANIVEEVLLMKESGKHLNQPCNRALLLYTELTLTLLMLEPFLKNKAQNEMLLPCII